MAWRNRPEIWEKILKISFEEKGNGYLLGSACPFCGQKNKFYVNPSGYYECKSDNRCGKKGHMKRLLQDHGYQGYNYNSNSSEFDGTRQDHVQDLQSKYDKSLESIFNSKEALDYLVNKRGILPETLKECGVGYLNDHIVFPWYRGGELVALKYRNIFNKAMYQEPKGVKGAFLLHKVTTDEPIVVCEGEMDALTLWQYGIQNLVCINGVNGDHAIIDQILTQSSKIIFIADQDKAGQKAIEKWSEKYGFDKCYQVALPEKDINECLVSGVTDEELITFIRQMYQVPIPGTKAVNAVKEDLKKDPIIPILRFPVRDIDRLLGGLYESEATIISGEPGVGKTAFATGIVRKLAGTGNFTVYAALEESAESITNKYLSDYSTNHVMFFDPKDYHIFYDSKKIQKYFESFVKRHDMKLFILDHLEWISEYYKKGDSVNSAAICIKNIVKAAQQVKVNTGKGFHIVFLHHMRKLQRLENIKDGTIRIKRPSKGDLLYSGTREAHNIIFLHREYDNNKGKIDDSGSVEVIVEKNRSKGELGSAMAFYDKEKGRYIFE